MSNFVFSSTSICCKGQKDIYQQNVRLNLQQSSKISSLLAPLSPSSSSPFHLQQKQQDKKGKKLSPTRKRNVEKDIINVMVVLVFKTPVNWEHNAYSFFHPCIENTTLNTPLPFGLKSISFSRMLVFLTHLVLQQSKDAKMPENCFRGQIRSGR